MSVFRISLDENNPGKVELHSIYEVHSAKIILVEPDPDNTKQLFVLEDDQKLTRIEDVGEGKATIKSSYDLTHHILEDAITILD